MKDNFKILMNEYNVCSIVIWILLIILIATANFCVLLAQLPIVRNGSFENHYVNQYPSKLTPSSNYSNNEFMRCIGFCGMFGNFTWSQYIHPIIAIMILI